MKIEAEGNDIILSEVFSGVTIKTREGKELHVCLRDCGFDMRIGSGPWHHVNEEKDFAELPHYEKTWLTDGMIGSDKCDCPGCAAKASDK